MRMIIVYFKTIKQLPYVRSTGNIAVAIMIIKQPAMYPYTLLNFFYCCNMWIYKNFCYVFQKPCPVWVKIRPEFQRKKIFKLY